MKRERDIQLIVIDYLQMIDHDNGTAQNNIGNVPGKLKALAAELQIPVMVLSTLGRQLEKRADKRPLLSDLPDNIATAVLEHADGILFLYRDDLYCESSPAKGFSELIPGRTLSPPPGEVLLSYDAKLSRFSEVTIPDSNMRGLQEEA